MDRVLVSASALPDDNEDTIGNGIFCAESEAVDCDCARAPDVSSFVARSAPIAGTRTDREAISGCGEKTGAVIRFGRSDSAIMFLSRSDPSGLRARCLLSEVGEGFCENRTTCLNGSSVCMILCAPAEARRCAEDLGLTR